MAKILLITLVILAIVGSCGGDKKPVDSEQPFTIDMFQNSVGTSWTYQVTDTLNQISKTMSIYINDSVTLFGNLPATSWLVLDSDFVAWVDFVVTIGDTVWFYRDQSVVPYRKIVFPLETGRSWQYDAWGGYDICSVLTWEAIAVPNGIHNSYHIKTEMNFMALDPIYFSHLWVAPDVGFIRMDIAEGFRIIESYEIWELIDFNRPD